VTLPIDLEMRHIKPRAGPYLPIRGDGNRTKQLDLMLLLAGQEMGSFHITRIDHMGARQHVLVCQGLMDPGRHLHVLGGGWGGLDVYEEMRQVVVTGFGHMHLVG
jgi:hypothetical protein